MAYTPNNAQVYVNAFAGALGGMAIGGYVSDSTAADYGPITACAQAFAQQFDATWGATAPSACQLALIEEGAANIFSQRTPSPPTNVTFQAPSNWAGPVNALVAIVQEVEVNNVANGVNSPTGGFTSGAAVYGDGSDGNATLDGVTTFNAFSSLAGSVYTLTRDTFLNNATVNTGVTINTASFKLFVLGTLTLLGTATITNNGGAGAGGGAGGAGGTAAPNGSLEGSHAGGAGGTFAAGTNGTAGNAQQPGGASAGSGGAGGANAGGTGGAFTAQTAAFGSMRDLAMALTGMGIGVGGTSNFQGAPSGGGGGSSAVGTTGGGGGGGGGIVIVAAQTLVVAATAAIQANGGPGGAASGAANGGGGGGGAGGTLVVISRTNKASAGTLQATGGAGGAGVGAGVAGAAGGAGVVIQLAA